MPDHIRPNVLWIPGGKYLLVEDFDGLLIVVEQNHYRNDELRVNREQPIPELFEAIDLC